MVYLFYIHVLTLCKQSSAKRFVCASQELQKQSFLSLEVVHNAVLNLFDSRNCDYNHFLGLDPKRSLPKSKPGLESPHSSCGRALRATHRFIFRILYDKSAIRDEALVGCHYNSSILHFCCGLLHDCRASTILKCV